MTPRPARAHLADHITASPKVSRSQVTTKRKRRRRRGSLQSDYENAINQAGPLAGYGFQGANLNANLGFSGVGNGDQWRGRKGFIQPTGTDSDTQRLFSDWGVNAGIGDSSGSGRR